MEPGTLLLRLVNSQEFNESVNPLLVWFTDCGNFSNLNNSNFEICAAGVGSRRLYYDDDNRYTTQNCYSSFTVIQLHTCCNLGKKIIFVVIVRTQMYTGYSLSEGLILSSSKSTVDNRFLGSNINIF